MKFLDKIKEIFTIQKFKKCIRSQFTIKKIINHIADIVLCILILFSCVGDRIIGYNISKRLVFTYFALYMIPKMYRFFLRCGNYLDEGKEMLKETRKRADEYLYQKEKKRAQKRR